CPSTITSSSIAACTTRPKTTVEFPSPIVLCTTHSNATGDPATRGGFTRKLASCSTPTASNSLIPCGKFVAVALTCSNSPSGARFTTNSPVSSTFRSESLRPTEVNCTTGGATAATVKNECGARFAAPSWPTVDTQAIGRGTITEVSSL